MATFDVPVDNHVAVQVGHALQDLLGVLPGHVFRERPIGLQLVFHRALENASVRTNTSLLGCMWIWMCGSISVIHVRLNDKDVCYAFANAQDIRGLTPGMYSMKMVRVFSLWSRRQP